MELVLVLRLLERKAARAIAQKLQRALDAEALAIFHVARRLELEVLEELPKKLYSKTAIIARLREQEFTPRHEVLSGHLGRLVEGLRKDPRRWYEQAKTLLDAASRVEAHLRMHDTMTRNLRRRQQGRPPSVAIDFLLDMTADWSITASDLASRLVAARINPERETDEDVTVQWKGAIKRARSRRRARLRESKSAKSA